MSTLLTSSKPTCFPACSASLYVLISCKHPVTDHQYYPTHMLCVRSVWHGLPNVLKADSTTEHTQNYHSVPSLKPEQQVALQMVEGMLRGCST